MGCVSVYRPGRGTARAVFPRASDGRAAATRRRGRSLNLRPGLTQPRAWRTAVLAAGRPNLDQPARPSLAPAGPLTIGGQRRAASAQTSVIPFLTLHSDVARARRRKKTQGACLRRLVCCVEGLTAGLTMVARPRGSTGKTAWEKDRSLKARGRRGGAHTCARVDDTVRGGLLRARLEGGQEGGGGETKPGDS